MDYKIPDFYKYLTWYELKSPLDIYNFVQEMKNDNVDLNNYPDIQTYYNILIEHAFKEEADMVIVDYVVKKLRGLFITYGLAHGTYLMNLYTGKQLYFYWNERKE